MCSKAIAVISSKYITIYMFVFCIDKDSKYICILVDITNHDINSCVITLPSLPASTVSVY